MSNGTSIASLPTNQNNQYNENIRLVTREKTSVQYNPDEFNVRQTQPIQSNRPHSTIGENATPPLIPSSTGDNNDIQQILNEIKLASENNMTQLPSRDIPIQTQQYVADKQVKANYIPEPTPEKTKDYIKDLKEEEKQNERKRQQIVENEKLDMFYQELQTPLLIMVLFFIFQLPVFDFYFLKLFPFLKQKDSQLTLVGYLVKTAIFGALFFGFHKLTDVFARFL